MESPSHLLWLNLPLLTDLSLFGIDTETQYVFLTSIPAIWNAGKGYANVAFIRDGIRLENYSHFLQGMRDGMGNGSGQWATVSGANRAQEESLRGAIFGILQKKTTSVDLSDSRLSRKWTESIDREWLRVLEGDSKIARVKKKVRLVLDWSAWRCSNELESRTNLWSSLAYLGFRSLCLKTCFCSNCLDYPVYQSLYPGN